VDGVNGDRFAGGRVTGSAFPVSSDWVTGSEFRVPAIPANRVTGSWRTSSSRRETLWLEEPCADSGRDVKATRVRAILSFASLVVS